MHLKFHLPIFTKINSECIKTLNKRPKNTIPMENKYESDVRLLFEYNVKNTSNKNKSRQL